MRTKRETCNSFMTLQHHRPRHMVREPPAISTITKHESPKNISYFSKESIKKYRYHHLLTNPYFNSSLSVSFRHGKGRKSCCNMDLSPNIFCFSTTMETSQALMSWLNKVAIKNISCMSVTLDTFQDTIFWLKDDALQNIFLMQITLDTFQEPMS
jgi:hypothetical protein